MRPGRLRLGLDLQLTPLRMRCGDSAKPAAAGRETPKHMQPKTSETKARVALENAADLPRGRSFILHGMNRDLFVLRRDVAGDCFFLRLESPRDTQHGRFCDNLGQLLEDLEYFFRSDALPFQKVNWF